MKREAPNCDFTWHDLVHHACSRPGRGHHHHVCPCGAQHLDPPFVVPETGWYRVGRDGDGQPRIEAAPGMPLRSGQES